MSFTIAFTTISTTQTEVNVCEDGPPCYVGEIVRRNEKFYFSPSGMNLAGDILTKITEKMTELQKSLDNEVMFGHLKNEEVFFIGEQEHVKIKEIYVLNEKRSQYRFNAIALQAIDCKSILQYFEYNTTVSRTRAKTS